MAEGVLDLWDVDRTAEYLDRHPSEVRRLIREGKLPGAVKLGPRSTRVDPVILQAWVRAGAPDLTDASYEAVAAVLVAEAERLVPQARAG